MNDNPRFRRISNWVTEHRTWLTAGLIFMVLMIAGLTLREILKGIHWADIVLALKRIQLHQILLSIALTTVSYFVLTGYDVLALRTIKKPQSYWRAALASFSAYCLSHNFGFAPITGTAARLRAYARTNLDLADIARIVVIAGFTFWLGVFLILGVIMLFVPGAVRISSHTLPFLWQALIGLLILTMIAAYLVVCHFKLPPINIMGWHLPVPTLDQALKQFLLAATDLAIASAALLVLLPADLWHHYPDFLIAYVIAMVVALLTHAPGGIGVFESVILLTLPEVSRPDLFSALILYRIIYFWLPLGVAVLMLLFHELRIGKKHGNLQI